jgi:hypothetical protein
MPPVNNRNRGAKVSSEARHLTATWHAGTVRSKRQTNRVLGSARVLC